jgi:hypothetical protein
MRRPRRWLALEIRMRIIGLPAPSSRLLAASSASTGRAGIRPSRARADLAAILLTTSEKRAHATIGKIDRQLTVLPTADIARIAWRDYEAIET